VPQNKKRPHLPPVPESAKQGRAEQRAAASRLVRDQEKRAKRRSLLIQASIGLVAVVAVIVTTVVVLANRGPDEPAATPPGLTSDGAVRFGPDDTTVTIQTVEDFQCPACQRFETEYGDVLAGYRDSGEVAVEYRTIAFLDRASSTDYSSRALNASMCVLDDAGSEVWMRMHEALFAQQPAEGGAGLSDVELTRIAEDAGAGDVSSCIADRPFDDWAKDTTQAVFDEGVTSTPTVFVNGAPVEPAQLEDAVVAALG